MNLCDSDWMIDLLGGRDAALRLVGPMLEDGIALSIISVGEVYEGILNGNDAEWNEQRFGELLEQVTVIGLDLPAMRIYGSVRGQLRRTGHLIGENDLLIAATALRHDLTLVTRNRRHFDRVAGLRIHDADVSSGE